MAADLLPNRYGVVFVPHRHTRRFVRPIKETGKRPRPDRMGLGLFFCKVCRKIMPPGGARVLRSAHHDAAVVFGGVALSGAFAPLPGLRHPASAALRLRLAGRGPNSDSLFPPLAAVVAVAPRGRGFVRTGKVCKKLQNPLANLPEMRYNTSRGKSAGNRISASLAQSVRAPDC